ncbi:MAG: hypothetical protein HY964_03130 [Ignavibacteriales bacterium]|nr:hypothetical protein [Ignavibacteriales bacterium]
MFNRCKIFILIYFFLLSSGINYSYGQPTAGGNRYELKFRSALSTDTVIILPHNFVIPKSLTIQSDSAVFCDSLHYFYNPDSNSITIKKIAIDSIQIPTKYHEIKISYNYFPISLKKSFRHREPLLLSDSVKNIPEKIVSPTSSFSPDQLFGSNIQTSGSLVRGFSFGTNRDLSLNSGFRMQMSGKLANDVDVIASLTDENSPLQPEGSTQTLQEIDKVLIEIRSENMSATLGDININIDQNEFGMINRKLSGAKGSVDYNVGNFRGGLSIAGAVTRGKYFSNEFSGLDGVQGAYRLYGERNNRDIIVIAASERVFINGEKMQRGENADYTIDYATAEITFMPRRLITTGSRIIVDFEYTDRQFNRSLYGAQTGFGFLNDKLKMNLLFFKESDNENAPVDISLSDSDKSILRNAGYDPAKANRSGVELVGAGKGQYSSIDTLVKTKTGEDSLVKIFKYNPVDTIISVYNVVFSFTGDNKGSYRKISVGNYQFAGLGYGNYEPIRYLSLPESRSLMDLGLSIKPTDKIEIKGEYAVSEFSRNKFYSEKGIEGKAFVLNASYLPENISVAGMNFGLVSLNIKNKFIGKEFSAMDRVNEVEFRRNWNINDSSKQDENIFEGSIIYTPNQIGRLNAQIGEVTRGKNISTNRYMLNAELLADNLPRLDYNAEYLKSKNDNMNLKSEWSRQNLKGKYRIGIFDPRFKLSYEKLINREAQTDSQVNGSFRWTDIGGGIGMNISEKFRINADAAIQYDDSLLSGNITRAGNRFIHEYSTGWNPSELFSFNAGVTAQNRKFSQKFLDRRNNDNSNLLIRWQINTMQFDRLLDLELFYEATRGRAAKYERLFQRVPKGAGSYVYIGDLNHNYIIDQEDFQLSRFDGEYVAVTVQGDQLLPVTEVKASGRFRLEPDKLISGTKWWEMILSSISSETYIRVEEKNTTSKSNDIYFLNTSKFLNNLTTISGNNLIVQDLNILRNDRYISFVYRYTQNQGLTQYSLSGERIYKREHLERIRWQLIDEIGNQTEIVQKVDSRTAVTGGLRSHSIITNSFSTDWSYRPWQEFEMGLKFGFGKSVNFDTTSADQNQQSVRFRYGFSLEGDLGVEFTREEVLLNRNLTEPLFEITDGKVRGQSWLWNFTVDYRIAAYLRLEINYLGRSEGGGSPVHNAKAELRAFF